MNWTYVRAGYFVGGKFSTRGEQRGSITEDPRDAVKRHTWEFERNWKKTRPHLPVPGRAGRVWMVWRFPVRPTLDQAKRHAAAYRPAHLLVMLSEGDDWKGGLVELLIHPETDFKFRDYAWESTS